MHQDDVSGERNGFGTGRAAEGGREPGGEEHSELTAGDHQLGPFRSERSPGLSASEIRDRGREVCPDFASLNPGYDAAWPFSFRA